MSDVMTSPLTPIHASVYKSRRKLDTYLFVPKPNQFDHVPETLRKLLGELEFVLEVELTAERKLANAQVQDVMSSLHGSGYYLQLPPGE